MQFKILSHLNVTYTQLLLYGIHIGHSFVNSILYAAWMVYSYTRNLLLINLYKTFWMWKIGFRVLASACWIRGPIWFINLDGSFVNVLKHAALSCGEMYWAEKWVHGLISNYLTLENLYSRLRKYSSLAYTGRQKWVQIKLHDWILTRDLDLELFLFQVFFNHIDRYVRLWLLVYLVLV